MPHEFDYRIAYADTDRMGVVYYANYLVLFERGRTELLRDAGLRYRDLEEDPGVFLPAVSASVDYLAPAHYDDLIRMRTWVSAVGRASLSFRYEILNADTGRRLAYGDTRHSFVNRDWKPVRVPENIKPILAALGH
jgi:acyl-CoA thioester hydrolase